MDWFKIGKGVGQGYILSLGLFNLHAEYIMWNARRDEAQARIRIARRNINNLRYADDTTLMEESEEELKRLLMKVREEGEKAGLKLNIKKLRSWHLVPSLCGNRWGNNGNSERLFYLAPKSLQMVTAAMKLKRRLLLGRKAMTNLAY